MYRESNFYTWKYIKKKIVQYILLIRELCVWAWWHCASLTLTLQLSRSHIKGNSKGFDELSTYNSIVSFWKFVFTLILVKFTLCTDNERVKRRWKILLFLLFSLIAAIVTLLKKFRIILWNDFIHSRLHSLNSELRMNMTNRIFDYNNFSASALDMNSIPPRWFRASNKKKTKVIFDTTC